MDFEQLRKDMEDGTEGPWQVKSTSVFTRPNESYVALCVDSGTRSFPEALHNARRIARVPDLERIALAAEEYRKARLVFLKDCKEGDHEVTDAGRAYIRARVELFALLKGD